MGSQIVGELKNAIYTSGYTGLSMRRPCRTPQRSDNERFAYTLYFCYSHFVDVQEVGLPLRQRRVPQLQQLLLAVAELGIDGQDGGIGEFRRSRQAHPLFIPCAIRNVQLKILWTHFGFILRQETCLVGRAGFLMGLGWATPFVTLDAALFFTPRVLAMSKFSKLDHYQRTLCTGSDEK